MNLPNKLEKFRDESSEKYGGTVTLRETRIRRIAGFNSGFNAACDVLLPEIEKMREAFKDISDHACDDTDCDYNAITAIDALKQWQEFAEGE